MYQQKFIRFPQLKEIVGLSRSSIFRQEKTGNFPKRRQIGSHSVAWLWSEIQEWIESRTPKEEPKNV